MIRILKTRSRWKLLVHQVMCSMARSFGVRIDQPNMDTAILSAGAALVGSLIGGISTFAGSIDADDGLALSCRVIRQANARIDRLPA